MIYVLHVVRTYKKLGSPKAGALGYTGAQPRGATLFGLQTKIVVVKSPIAKCYGGAQGGARGGMGGATDRISASTWRRLVLAWEEVKAEPEPPPSPAFFKIFYSILKDLFIIHI